jgi:hypothetical protein
METTEYNYYEQKSNWLRERAGKFTSSMIFKLMTSGRRKDQYFGDGAITYIHQRAAELLTGLPCNDSAESARAVEWGIAHEMEGIQEYEKRHGVSVEYYGRANPKFFLYGNYAGGSPDAMIDAYTGLEIKCPYNSGEHVEHLLLKTPLDLKDYSPQKYWQCIANTLFTGATSWIFSSYDPRFPVYQYQLTQLVIDANTDEIQLLEQRIAEAEKELTSTVVKLMRLYGDGKLISNS